MTAVRYALSAWFAGLAVLSALSGIDGGPLLAASYAVAAGYVAFRLAGGGQ